MLPLLNMEAPSPSQSGGKPQHQLMRTVSISVLVMSLPVLYVSFLHVPPAALFRDTTFWFLMSNSIIIVIAADSGMLFSRSSSDDSSSSIPFVVYGADESVSVKTGGLVISAVSDEVVVHGQALVVSEHGDHAYALVVREDQLVASTPANREMIISPSAAAGEAVAVKNVDAGAIVPARPRRSSRLAASRSHRPSQSQALVPVEDKNVVVVREEKQQLRRTATDRRPSPPSPPAADDVEKESEYSMLSDEELNRRVEEFITRFNREIRQQLEKEEQAAAA